MKLVIAEKPSVAMSIAQVIGANSDKGDGFVKGNGYIVTWCVGHLVTSASPEEYNPELANWSLDTLPILPEQYKLSVAKSTQKQYEVVKKLMLSNEVTSLICATDAGREGELIFRLVYNMAGCTKPFERLWISSMENQAIKDGFNLLMPGTKYDNLYQSAFARLRADWYVGMNCSRLFSVLSGSKLSIGRVQTPVLNLIVQRQREIDGFTPVPYYILEADCGDFVAKSDKYEKKEIAESAAKLCNGAEGKVTKLEEKQRKDNPPALFDLTTLQREGNKRYGYTAKQVIDAAQNLYEKKLITYPRTDSKFLTDTMKKSTEKLVKDFIISHHIDGNTKRAVNTELFNVDKVINNKKVSDHHAIIPTETALNKDTSDLSAIEQKILSLVIHRLLASTYIACEYNETSVTLEIKGKEFYAKGKKITNLGYKAILNDSSEDTENSDTSISSAVVLNKEYESVSVALTAKKTSPPKPYDDASLLAAMENAGNKVDDDTLKTILKKCEGIGTPATRAGIIERLITVGYIERKKKIFVPTQKAFALIDTVPEEIKSVELTAQWEQRLTAIANGEENESDFIKGIFGFVTAVIDNNKELDLDKSAFAKEKVVVGVCPRCGKNVIENSKAFTCESGKDGCGFVIFKDNKWWSEKKKTLTASIVKKLLSDGKVKVKGLYSSKKDKKYEAVVAMVDTGQYVNFKLLF